MTGWGNQGHPVYLCCDKYIHGDKDFGLHVEKVHGLRRTQMYYGAKLLPWCHEPILVCRDRAKRLK